MTTAFNLSQVANYLNSSGQLNLATGVYGTLPQANGGTGASSLASVAVTSLTAGVGISLNASVGAITITNTGGAGGANSPSSSTDVTLTNASVRVQAITMTAANKRVILPDATTISTLGGPLFIITNTGAYTFDVATADGYVLAYLEPGESMSVALSSAASANANWITDKNGFVGLTTTQSTLTGLSVAQTTTSYPLASDIEVTALSSSAVLIGYVDKTTSDMYAVVATISGTTISFGTPFAVAVGTYQRISVCSLSSTAAFIVGTTSGSSYAVYALVISGTTITASAAYTQASQNSVSIRKLDSTRAILTYASTAGSSTSVRIMQHNGTSAITAGSGVNWIGTSYNLMSMSGRQADVITIDTNKFVCFATPGVARVATVSGTTITLGTTSATLQSNSLNVNNMTQVVPFVYSTTECGIMFTSTVSIQYQAEVFCAICNISGTGATWGAVSRVGNSLNSRPLGVRMLFDGNGYFTYYPVWETAFSGFAQLDSTTAVVGFSVDNNYYKVKYIPTVGWKYSNTCSSNNSPFGFALTPLSSTSAFVIGASVLDSDGVTMGTAQNMRAALLKNPT